MSGYRHRRRKRYRQKEATGERPKVVSYRVCIGGKKKGKKKVGGCVCAGWGRYPECSKARPGWERRGFFPLGLLLAAGAIVVACCLLLVARCLLLVACRLSLPVPWLAGSQSGMGIFLKMARECSNS